MSRLKLQGGVLRLALSEQWTDGVCAPTPTVLPVPDDTKQRKHSARDFIKYQDLCYITRLTLSRPAYNISGTLISN